MALIGARRAILLSKAQKFTSVLASASTRARQAIAVGVNTNTNNFVTYQVPDYALAPVTNPVIFVSNKSRSQATGLEVNAAYPLYYCHAFCAAPNGVSKNQTGKTFQFVDWSAAANDTQIQRPDGTMGSAIVDDLGAPQNYAAFVTAGGSVATVSGNPVVTIPGGWGVFGTATGLTLSGQYLNRILASGPISTTAAIQTAIQANGNTDWTKSAASHAASLINTADWTGVSGLSAALATVPYPATIYGTNAAGVRTAWVTGDSIATGEPGDGYGDYTTYYTSGGWKRALALRGVPFVATSVPSTKASQIIGRTLAHRNIIVGIASIVVHNYGHNEQGTAWGTGALTPLPTAGNAYVAGDGLFHSIHSRFNIECRSFVKPGALVVASTLTPTQLGGINSGGTAISSLSSVGTLATATVASTSLITTGQYVSVHDATVPGYSGNVQATVINSTTFTFTIPAGGSGLATTTTAKYAPPSTLFTTGAPASYYNFLTHSATVAAGTSYTGGTFTAANGDPDFALDAYSAIGGVFTGAAGLYPAWEDTHEGTHPLGNNSSLASNSANMVAFSTALQGQFAAMGI